MIKPKDVTVTSDPKSSPTLPLISDSAVDSYVNNCKRVCAERFDCLSFDVSAMLTVKGYSLYCISTEDDLVKSSEDGAERKGRPTGNGIIASFALSLCDTPNKSTIYALNPRLASKPISECVLPFRSMGVVYEKCTTLSLGMPWCPTNQTDATDAIPPNLDDHFSNNWGLCIS